MKKISKFLTIAVGSVMLAGCFGIGGPRPLTPTVTQYRVVMPETRYFTCDRVRLPDPSTLTDVQIANLINDLVRANRQCSNNMNAIRQYLESAQQVVDQRNTTPASN